ncbi:methyltransferase domain-containing protein [Synechococcus sp. Tobar12-5m-g]|uniref:methyltransferase domain-containing protein n=1 Tax=unclassified Synechococcus TaxID=2626047 RepID=UPI0020CB9146|nr:MULTISPECIES: methyltransferase domain-containing protein [unclassified Synechococcus]MCP9773191.1 methyltransferase domain-containing protein [Synechococcus sp. Tobar12-5m-g]MCP9874133.1 methyltransferase domain-containing protein [Synechococcus sp. Cruz CV-v-12]
MISSPSLELVRGGFERRVSSYEQGAALQRSVAWRLAHHCCSLPLLEGPCADLGSGTGLLSRAIAQQRPELDLLRLDACPALLSQEGAAALAMAATPPASLIWDLNQGLPPELQQASLLASSFALHWLNHPVEQMEHWCQELRPDGWLALALPTAGSFPQWRQAAARAGVACTALPLPEASALVAAAEQHLDLHRAERLRFSQHAESGLSFLRRMRDLGAGASPSPPLRPGEWRRLEAHWPSQPGLGGGGKLLRWEMLLLLGRKPPP